MLKLKLFIIPPERGGIKMFKLKVFIIPLNGGGVKMFNLKVFIIPPEGGIKMFKTESVYYPSWSEKLQGAYWVLSCNIKVCKVWIFRIQGVADYSPLPSSTILDEHGVLMTVCSVKIIKHFFIENMTLFSCFSVSKCGKEKMRNTPVKSEIWLG